MQLHIIQSSPCRRSGDHHLCSSVFSMAPSIQTLLSQERSDQSPSPCISAANVRFGFPAQFLAERHVQRGLLKCWLPFSAYAKKQPNLGWPQLVVQLEGEALGGLYPRQIPGR